MFKNNPTDTRTALALIRDSSDVLGLLLDGGHNTIAGRLAGAFRNIGQGKIADDIVKTMQTAGFDVRETDLFVSTSPLALDTGEVSPYVNRIKLMWHEMREVVIKHFPKAPGLPNDQKKYMKLIEEIYITDAYHSLSIEKYKVTPELIDRVRSGTWDIEINEEDKRQRDVKRHKLRWLEVLQKPVLQ